MLFRHPQSPTLAVTGLHTEVAQRGGGLLLTYRLSGDLGQLRLPVARTPDRIEGLWRHTCFEAFVAPEEGETYREFNFSPAGHWQAYSFTSYRQGGPLDQAIAPDIATQIEAHALILSVRLPAANLPAGPRLRLGLSAVLEAADGRLAYWALRHGPGQPDFHRADAFVLTLDLSGNPT